jgi:hypothetical protein
MDTEKATTQILAGRSSEAAVRNGCTVVDPYEEVRWPFPDWGSPDPLAGDPFPDELLRFGVQFADGRRVTNMDRYPFVPEDLPADQPVLVEGGGVGSEGGRLGRGYSPPTGGPRRGAPRVWSGRIPAGAPPARPHLRRAAGVGCLVPSLGTKCLLPPSSFLSNSQANRYDKVR